VAGSYETEDGEPKYGRRLSQEELDAYRREHRLPAPDSSSSGRRPTRTASGAVGAEADPTAGPGLQGRAAPVGTGESTAAEPAWGHGEQIPLRRWRLLVAGLIVMLLVPFAMTAGALLYVVEGPLSAGAALGETGTVYLEQGSNWALYSPSLAGSTLECSVTDPAGNSLPLEGLGEGITNYAAFAASTTGTYIVSCPGGTTGVVVGPTVDVSRVPAAGTVILAAGACSLLGFGLTVAGGVRALSPRRRR